MPSILEFKHKIINTEPEDLISIVNDTEIVWDDTSLNNRVFQEILLLGDLENVKRMLTHEKYHLNLKIIDCFFFEKLTDSKTLPVFLYLVENHYIDDYIDDLFVYIAPNNFDLLKYLVRYIKNPFTFEKALINIIYQDNLKNFAYLLDQCSHYQFQSDFLTISVQQFATKINAYISPGTLEDKILIIKKELLECMLDYLDFDEFSDLNEKDEYTTVDVDNVDKLIDHFMSKLQKIQNPTEELVMENVKTFVLSLNNLNEKSEDFLIGNEERELLCALIFIVVKNTGIQVADTDFTEQWRTW